MTRGLDHIVHAVRDLDSAAAAYRNLGFTVGVRNRHPWGTHNHIVQFPGFFIELLMLAEPDKLSGDLFSNNFGIYNRDFAIRHEGLSMLVLESTDSSGDVEAFKSAGIAASASTRFDREGRRPDGTPVHLAFSLAFASEKAAPDIRFFTCQQHYPENLWNPSFQTHGNGATGIAAVIMVADDPARHRDFLLAYTGAGDMTPDEGSYTIVLPSGAIEVMTPGAFTARYGLAAPVTDEGPRLAAMRFASPTAARSLSMLGAGLIFGPDH